MPPLRLEIGPLPLDWQKPVNVRWNAVEGALGYRLRVTGIRGRAGEPGRTGILWSSSPLPLWESDAAIGDPVAAARDGQLIAPLTPACTVHTSVVRIPPPIHLSRHQTGSSQFNLRRSQPRSSQPKFRPCKK